MVERQSIFKYKIIKGPLHKLPALLKLILLFIFSVFCIILAVPGLAAGVITVIIAAFLCGLSINDQLTDLKPAALYIIILYAFSVIANLTDYIRLENQNSSLFIPSSAPYWTLCTAEAVCTAKAVCSVLIPYSGYLRLALRLVLIVQMSALVFRTTSSLEIREAVRFDTITLFISFIPEIFKTWSGIDLAWKARGGRPGIRKIKTLVFILISCGFEKAAVKARALEARNRK